MEQDWKARHSGYKKHRQLGPDGQLTSETHTYGFMEIALIANYAVGKKTSEMYFMKAKAITRKKYESVRVAYPEMPPADGTLEDQLVELRRIQAEERRASAKRQKRHQPNFEAGRKIDAFCQNLSSGENCEDISTWIEKPNTTLGELSRRASREIVRSLKEKGAVRIIACAIDRDPFRENTGELVVVLPDSPEPREKSLKVAGNWAVKLGFDPVPDDGQTMIYIKLD